MLQLGSNLFLLNEGTSSASVLQMSGTSGVDTSFGSNLWPQFDSLDHIRWGIGDNQLNLMRKVIHRNSIVRPLLKLLRYMIYGSGVGFFKRSMRWPT
jgi:hypothetical protein